MTKKMDRYNLLHKKYTGQSLEMNYKDFADFIDEGRPDAYVTIHLRTEGTLITYVASYSNEFHEGWEKDLFSLDVESGSFKLIDIEGVGGNFGEDRKKAVLAYLAQDKSVWNKSALFAKIYVIGEDCFGNKCVLKNINSDKSYPTFRDCKLDIISSDTDLNKLGDEYVFDFKDSWGIKTDYVSNTKFPEPKEIIIVRNV